MAQTVKNLWAMQEIWVQSLVGKIPGEGHGYPLQYSCLENSMNRGAWPAIVHRVTNSQTRLSDLYTHIQPVSPTVLLMVACIKSLDIKVKSTELEHVTDFRILKQKGLNKAFLIPSHYRQSHPVILRDCLFSLGFDMSKVYIL